MTLPERILVLSVLVFSIGCTPPPPERDDSTYMDRMRKAQSTVERYGPRASREDRIELQVHANRLKDCYFELYDDKVPLNDKPHLEHELQIKMAEQDFAQHGNSDRYNEQIQRLEEYWKGQSDNNVREHFLKVKRWANNRDECYAALEAYEVVANSLIH